MCRAGRHMVSRGGFVTGVSGLRGLSTREALLTRGVSFRSETPALSTRLWLLGQEGAVTGGATALCRGDRWAGGRGHGRSARPLVPLLTLSLGLREQDLDFCIYFWLQNTPDVQRERQRHGHRRPPLAERGQGAEGGRAARPEDGVRVRDPHEAPGALPAGPGWRGWGLVPGTEFTPATAPARPDVPSLPAASGWRGQGPWACFGQTSDTALLRPRGREEPRNCRVSRPASQTLWPYSGQKAPSGPSLASPCPRLIRVLGT